MKQQKRPDDAQTGFDKTENVHPFTKYMVSKGKKRHYIPHIFTIQPGAQFSIAEAAPLSVSDSKRVQLYSKLCKQMSQVQINVHEIIQIFANAKQNGYKDFSMGAVVPEDSVFAIPPVRKNPSTNPDPLDLMKIFKQSTKTHAINKTTTNQINSTIEFETTTSYVSLVRVDPNAPAVIASPFDAPEVMYAARLSLYRNQCAALNMLQKSGYDEDTTGWCDVHHDANIGQ